MELCEENAKQTVECLYNGYKIFEVEKTVSDGIGSYRKYFDYLAVEKRVALGMGRLEDRRAENGIFIRFGK
jgi:hypothetical protein